MATISPQDILGKLESALCDLRELKRQPQSEQEVRFIAVTITDLEKLMAVFQKFVANDGQ